MGLASRSEGASSRPATIGERRHVAKPRSVNGVGRSVPVALGRYADGRTVTNPAEGYMLSAVRTQDAAPVPAPGELAV
jgi:hypothetical protein